MKVLIVDDEADIRYLAALGLERFGGMTVREAATADEAIGYMKTEIPDVVLLDVVMPMCDGPAILRRIRGDADLAEVPVIFLTANPSEVDAARLVSLGARAVIAKPFDPVTLGAQIRSALVE